MNKASKATLFSLKFLQIHCIFPPQVVYYIKREHVVFKTTSYNFINLQGGDHYEI